METQIKITNEASVCTIDIEGVIGVPEEEQFGDTIHSVATYERLREEVERIKEIDAEEIVVNIRSTGGDVNDALLIYESLTALNAKITTRCYGYTASAATIIAQAASDGCREIASSALYLVHLSSSAIEGNASDLEERIELLKKTDDRIASLYALRSGASKDQMLALMGQNGGRGRWLSPEEVVGAGLADAVIGAEPTAKPVGLLDRVRAWFSPTESEVEQCDKSASVCDVNILHLPENLHSSVSTISFEEGQNAAKRTITAAKEDPQLEGMAVSQNALAYANDMNNLKLHL